jgi:hypothetical protein
MDIECSGNYVYTKMIDLNLSQQKQNAYSMYNFIQSEFHNIDEQYKDIVAPNISKKFTEYNYLMYPYLGMHKLYAEIQDLFYSVNDSPFDENYIRCWLNVYNKEEYIDWHSHWSKEYCSWHGFYCVDVEPDSYTLYRVNNKEIKVESKNNLLVISKSGEDVHRSSDWDQDYPRITIAFDIVPSVMLQQKHLLDINHWIPI